MTEEPKIKVHDADGILTPDAGVEFTMMFNRAITLVNEMAGMLSSITTMIETQAATEVTPDERVTLVITNLKEAVTKATGLLNEYETWYKSNVEGKVHRH